MTSEQAIGIYRQAFWERYHADQMPEAVAFQFFDACINHGYGNAARMLQRAAGVPDDGVIGAVSLNAINSLPENDLLLRFNAERLSEHGRYRLAKRVGTPDFPFRLGRQD